MLHGLVRRVVNAIDFSEKSHPYATLFAPSEMGEREKRLINSLRVNRMPGNTAEEHREFIEKEEVRKKREEEEEEKKKTFIRSNKTSSTHS